MSKLALAVALLVGVTTSATASDEMFDQARLSRAYHQCLGRDPSNSDIGQCIEAERERQEARLNEAYRMVMARLAPPRRVALRASERAWVRSRQGECDRVYREMEGGTGDGIALDTCMSVRAAERTARLEALR